MGREIRRVPPNWEHPKKEYNRYVRGTYQTVMEYKPMHDQPFAPAMDEWYATWKSWETDPEGRAKHDCDYFEWNGSPPDPEYYRPDWPEGSATWYQAYQTVSEGSPVTPPFATPEELVDYLVKNGDEWDQSRGNGGWDRKAAEQFVGTGFAMSLMVVNGKIYEPRDGMPDVTT